MITWFQLGFQDSNSPVIEEFIYFHDYTIIVLIYIITRVFVVIVGFGSAKGLRLYQSENQLLERV